MKLAIFDGAGALRPSNADWSSLRRQIDNVGADLVVTNEMPFG
jgi:hypothetical protein